MNIMNSSRRTTKSNSSSDRLPPCHVASSMYSDSGGNGAFPVPGTLMTPQGPWQGKEPHVQRHTLDIETATPVASQSQTHPQSRRQLHFEAKSLGKESPNRRMVIVPQNPKGVVQDGIAHDDPHVGPLGAVGPSEKFPDSDEGSKLAHYTSDDDLGKQGSGSNCTNQNDDKDTGSNVTTCLIKLSETDESKSAGKPADLSLAINSGSLGSDESIGEAREAIDDGVNGEMVFPVMRLSGKDMVVVVLPLHSWGGVEKSELVI